MNQHTHDPREHIRGIHQILISDKKRIGFLFGAGSSFATGVKGVNVPAIDDMTKVIVDEIEAQSPEFAAAVKEIRVETEGSDLAFTIESLLSTIEAKRAVIGAGTLNGLDSTGFGDLANLVKTNVVTLVSVHDHFHQQSGQNWPMRNLRAGFQRRGVASLPRFSRRTTITFLKLPSKTLAYPILMAFLEVMSHFFALKQ